MSRRFTLQRFLMPCSVQTWSKMLSISHRQPSPKHTAAYDVVVADAVEAAGDVPHVDVACSEVLTLAGCGAVYDDFSYSSCFLRHCPC